MTLDELFKAKGQLTTEIEIAQAKLQQVNKQIIDLINKGNVSHDGKDIHRELRGEAQQS